jgi:hypothetical protein
MVSGSADSMGPLREMAGALSPDLPALVAVTVHIGEQARSRLPWLLSRPGRIYVAAVAGSRQAEPAEAKLWGAAATARHLASHTDLGEEAASQQRRTADWASGLAESVRERVQNG